MGLSRLHVSYVWSLHMCHEMYSDHTTCYRHPFLIIILLYQAQIHEKRVATLLNAPNRHLFGDRDHLFQIQMYMIQHFNAKKLHPNVYVCLILKAEVYSILKPNYGSLNVFLINVAEDKRSMKIQSYIHGFDF